MATYLETQNRIANELNRSGLTAEIKLAILSAVEYYKRRRWPWNEYSTTLTCVIGTEYVALPTDFVELDKLQVTVGGQKRPLFQRDYSQIVDWRANSSNGEPTDFALWQNRIELFRVPNDTYTLTIHYIRSLAVLNADADENAWLTDAEELIRLHAKKDLYANKIRDTRSAQDMQALEDSALLRMESWHQRRTATGRTRAYYL
jgi:hypothetical protein